MSHEPRHATLDDSHIALLPPLSEAAPAYPPHNIWYRAGQRFIHRHPPLLPNSEVVELEVVVVGGDVGDDDALHTEVAGVARPQVLQVR